MTSCPSSDNSLDQWLMAEAIALRDSLDRVLDLDAGFADVRLLPDLQGILSHELEAILDLDAGLAAIVQNAPEPVVTQPKRDPAAGDELRLAAFARSLAALAPRERMAARLWLPGHAIRKIRTLVHLTKRGRQHSLDLVLDLDLVNSLLGEPAALRTRADVVTTTLDRALERAQVLNNALTEALDCIRADALADNHALADVLALAEALAGSLHRDQDRVHAAAKSRRTDLTLGLDLTRADALDLAHALAHAQELVFADALSDAGADALTNIARIGGHGHIERFNAFNDALTYDRDKALARADELRNADVSTHEHAFDLLQVTDVSDPLIAAADRMTTAITDMTSDDLSQMDLSGIPLQGIRWSDGSTGPATRWPADWADPVHRISISTSPGIWEIRDEIALNTPIHRPG